MSLARRKVDAEYFDYDSAEAHKLLSDNRALYIVQSANTVTGRAADFPSPPAAEQAAIPVAAAGGAFYSKDAGPA